ncbi:phosphoadenylyl-sulfate reductase [Roseitranquillus sediminis]|uniref:phosphoadenylyl-sulfate reductase n=1 Tax=Roseitranquillus sediminis TaxID=2809051 RepID=UPI001D0C81D6|nr:phosphoadenylyl-sulfate reductase [Roseitranquillus sediminis]MBM9594181.1 phosphoadenylyl-sulfate reductase [Roseitranquillus sediminis]
MRHDPRRISALNEFHAATSAEELVTHASRGLYGGRVAMISSFGADSAVLLHMLSEVAPDTPVLFVDSLMLFPETLHYQRDLAERLRLTGVRRISPSAEAVALHDPDGDLHRLDADACCHFRKVAPLDEVLAGFDVTISGRKRFQSVGRARIETFSQDQAGRLRLDPLAHWSRDDIGAYFVRHDLPRHPLVSRGYPSLGCAPCTRPVAPGEDERAGRWPGLEKDECGIHFADGRLVRTRTEGEDAA